MSEIMQWEDRIGRRLKLRDVHILLAAVQCGSMVKAAQALAISHPVVSKTIADLEHTIGVRLLERSRRGVVPTLYGRAVLEHGLAAFDELRQCVKKIEYLTDPEIGEVRIGSIPPLAATFVSAVIERLSQRHPKFQFHVRAGLVEALHRDLIERHIDLFIAWKLAPFSDELMDFQPLYDDSFVVVAGVRNPWARRRKIELRELLHEPWVLPPAGSAVGALAKEAFRASGLDCPHASVVALPREVLGLLGANRFLAIVAASTVRYPTKNPEIKILPIELPLARVPNGIFTLKGHTLSPAALLLVEQAHAVARPLKNIR
jgi:DNA-binding transcriptional LysR family regulator